MNNVRTFTIHSQEVKKDKQTFVASSAEIGGKWYKIKFTKDCAKSPKSKGLYELTINLDECSIEKGKPYMVQGGEVRIGNPTIWVRNVVDLVKYTDEQLMERNREALAEVFGE